MVFFGELAALTAAMSYATSSTLFSLTVKLTTPAQLNFLRVLVSMVFMYAGLLFFSDSIFPEDSLRNYFLLIISGILGIGIGDFFYIKALETIGPRKTILLETLAPPFTGLISYFYYGTTLSIKGWIGIFVVAYGIHTVVNEQNQQKAEHTTDIELGTELIQQTADTIDSPSIQTQSKCDQTKLQLSETRKNVIGMLCGTAFTFCQAFGMILSHDAASSKKFSSLQSALLRVISGLICCTLIILLKKGESFQWPYKNIEQNKLFFYACIIGPILGVWAQQTSLIFTRPEISQTILATTPLFGLAISWIRGEQMKARYLIGSLIAIAGVFIIIWS